MPEPATPSSPAAQSQEPTAPSTPASEPLINPKEHSVLGELEIVTINSKVFQNIRDLRVWLPGNYYAPVNRNKHYPVLYMQDGQNLFDEATAFNHEWRVDETVEFLTGSMRIGPMIVVGIDSTPRRANEYLPYPDPENKELGKPATPGRAWQGVRRLRDQGSHAADPAEVPGGAGAAEHRPGRVVVWRRGDAVHRTDASRSVRQSAHRKPVAADWRWAVAERRGKSDAISAEDVFWRLEQPRIRTTRPAPRM